MVVKPQPQSVIPVSFTSNGFANDLLDNHREKDMCQPGLPQLLNSHSLGDSYSSALHIEAGPLDPSNNCIDPGSAQPSSNCEDSGSSQTSSNHTDSGSTQASSNHTESGSTEASRNHLDLGSPQANSIQLDSGSSLASSNHLEHGSPQSCCNHVDNGFSQPSSNTVIVSTQSNDFYLSHKLEQQTLNSLSSDKSDMGDKDMFFLERHELSLLNDIDLNAANCDAIRSIQRAQFADSVWSVLELAKGISLVPLQACNLGAAQVATTQTSKIHQRLLTSIAHTNDIDIKKVIYVVKY